VPPRATNPETPGACERGGGAIGVEYRVVSVFFFRDSLGHERGRVGAQRLENRVHPLAELPFPGG
jgi:hypothetical protein